jgi:hypothetical protein
MQDLVDIAYKILLLQHETPDGALYRQLWSWSCVGYLGSRILINHAASVVDPDPGSGSVLDPYSIGPLDPDP